LTQIATLKYEWSLMADRPYLAGHAVWSFTDYATEHRKRYRRQPGLFDAWRQPKMAAELFRARYAEEPFVSLFVTGTGDDRELHIFSNCERILLTRDGLPAIELEAAPHHVVPLNGVFTGFRAEGVRGENTVRCELRSWREAATVAISIEEPETAPGRISPVDFTICDDAGSPVREWNGRVKVSIEGDARLFPFNEAGEVLVSRGSGRAYVEVGRSGEPFVVHAEANGLEPGLLRMASSSDL